MWIEEYSNFVHGINIFGYEFHLYTIPCLIVLAVLITMVLVHWYKQNKRKKQYEEELNGSMTESSGVTPETGDPAQ